MTDVDLFWVRNDLRLEDQPALTAAAEAGRSVVVLFVWSPDDEGPWSPGAASRWWLHHSLTAFADSLQHRGAQLVVRAGPAAEAIAGVLSETGAKRLLFNAHFEPQVRARDRLLKEKLEHEGIDVKVYNSSLLHHPEELKTGSGGPYRVFTAIWRALEARVEIKQPLPVADFVPYGRPLDSVEISELGLLPQIRWDAGLEEAWQPGERAAHKRLQGFLAHDMEHYSDLRNRPDLDRTSRLSPYLHFGELSPRSVYHAAQDYISNNPDAAEGADKFLAEIGWREFAHHVLYHFPETPTEPLQPKFERMPWKQDDVGLRKWQLGQTGYPIVDAGMRQLWATGVMHNRVRMIVGSFLCKDQLISWKRGAEWFWDTLVDADLASNTLGWQWIGGCGADAAPYFRIFNPITQGERFDPDGDYVRRWVPELKDMPKRFIHQPWNATAEVLSESGIELGETYPYPIVDHAVARKEALAALERTKS